MLKLLADGTLSPPQESGGGVDTISIVPPTNEIQRTGVGGIDGGKLTLFFADTQNKQPVIVEDRIVITGWDAVDFGGTIELEFGGVVSDTIDLTVRNDDSFDSENALQGAILAALDQLPLPPGYQTQNGSQSGHVHTYQIYWLDNYDADQPRIIIRDHSTGTGQFIEVLRNGEPVRGDFLDWQATAAEVQTGLENMVEFGGQPSLNIQPGDVVVTGPNGGPWDVEFKGRYLGRPVHDVLAELRGYSPGNQIVVMNYEGGSGDSNVGAFATSDHSVIQTPSPERTVVSTDLGFVGHIYNDDEPFGSANLYDYNQYNIAIAGPDVIMGSTREDIDAYNNDASLQNGIVEDHYYGGWYWQEPDNGWGEFDYNGNGNFMFSAGIQESDQMPMVFFQGLGLSFSPRGDSIPAMFIQARRDGSSAEYLGVVDGSIPDAIEGFFSGIQMYPGGELYGVDVHNDLWAGLYPGSLYFKRNGIEVELTVDAASIFHAFGADAMAVEHSFIAKSPDGTAYKLEPPDGGGPANWVAV